MKLLFTSLFFFVFTLSYSQNMTFNTFDFNAEIVRNDIPNSEISSALDSKNHTHILWVKTVGNVQSLMYSIYDNTSLTTNSLVTGNANERIAAPSLILDANDRPHAVYFKKRDINGGTTSGNYAVMYIGDGNGDGSFTSSQVSTNSTISTDNTDGLYNCYVNGRPSIAINNANSELTVFYYADDNTLNSFKNYIVSAKGNGTTWTHQQEYNLEDLPGGEPLASNDVNIDRRGYNSNMHGLIEIADYNPQYVMKNSGSWTSNRLTNYSGFGNVYGAQVEYDNNGNAFLLWYMNSTTTFYRAPISVSGVGNIEELAVIGQKSASSNYRPSVMDDVTAKWWASYQRSSGAIYITTKDQNNQVVESSLSNIGTYYGKRCLNVRNGFLSLVTASESNAKIYITTNGTSTSVANQSATNVNVFPNPTTDGKFLIESSDEILSIKIYSLEGKQIHESANLLVDISTYNDGVYFAHIITRKGTVIKKISKM